MPIPYSRRNDADDQQPWRCVTCGEAVSHIRHNDCACIRALRTREWADGAEEPFCACGRRLSQCDRSRKGCSGRAVAR
jgi:hypothetical protein